MAKRKSTQRVRDAMPKERAEFVSTALDLVNKASPMKEEAFHRAELTSNNLLHDGIMEAVTSGLAAPRHSACNRRTWLGR